VPAPVMLIELNEVNFDLIARYVDQGRLPTLGGLLARHGLARTSSETRCEDLEPWIQWVTAHTGQSLAEHGVFRLGDFVNSPAEQIWERLEARGLTVAALSPMNAAHRLKAPAFFLPDPWTATEITAPPLARALYGAIRQAVNDNAQARITAGSAAALAAGLVRFAAPRNYGRYTALAAGAGNAPWRKAMVLDLLLADLFRHLMRKGAADFASLFLNGAAHIQHHYLHSCRVAATRGSNPPWYCPPGADPVFEVYDLYDRIVGQIAAAFPAHRLMIATGLHQEPHDEPVYYWRLKDHAGFLRRVGVTPRAVRPLMSRDMVIEFDTAASADEAAERLRSLRDLEGQGLFEVENRGESLFAAFSYPYDIPSDFAYTAGNVLHRGLRDEVAFVAIKNGEHSGIGYFLDTGLAADALPREFALKTLPDRIMQACA